MITKDIFVGVCYHKPAPVVKTNILQPVHVGAAVATSRLNFAIADDTGTNISSKNKKWCEITAAYWMRHNVNAKYYGLMHYRRLLSFSPEVNADSSFVQADTRSYQKYGWVDQTIRELVSSADIVSPPTYNIHPVGMPGNLMTGYNFYAREHHVKDLDVCIDVARTANDDIFPYFLQSLKDTRSRFGNIFIMKRDLFFEYSDWMLHVLEETEQRLDTSLYDPHQARVIGFLAERLTEAYFRYAQSAKDARIIERPVVYGIRPPQPARASKAIAAAAHRLRQTAGAQKATLETINIAFAIDAGYAKHAAAAMHSVLLNARNPGGYHFYFFHNGDLSDDLHEKLEQVANVFAAQVSFIAIPIDSLRWLPMNRPHISMTTYYRLVMDKYLPADVHRIIYLDADTLATAPLEELWQSDLGDKMIGAAPDEGGVLQSRRLRLGAGHKYFNAGVLLLDMDRLRKVNLKALILKAFEDRGEYLTLQDQDLLNIAFENKTATLDLRWNVNNRIFVRNDMDPAYSDDQAVAAAQNPGILHFTDSRKPWHSKCLNPYYGLYWFHLNQTPWAEKNVEKFKRQLHRWLWCNLNSRYRRNIIEARLHATEPQKALPGRQFLKLAVGPGKQR